MRGVAAGDDERRDLETQEVFGLRPGRGVAIEHRPSHPDDELLIAIGVLLHERFGEGRIARDHGRPRTAPGAVLRMNNVRANPATGCLLALAFCLQDASAKAGTRAIKGAPGPALG